MPPVPILLGTFVGAIITETALAMDKPRPMVADVAAWSLIVDVIVHVEEDFSVRLAMLGTDLIHRTIMQQHNIEMKDMVDIAISFRSRLRDHVEAQRNRAILESGEAANAKPI